MEIKRTKWLLFIACLWLVNMAMMIAFSLIMTPFNLFSVIPVIGAALSLLNFFLLRKVYNEPLVFSDNKIIAYNGWWRGREELCLTDIVSVKCTKLAMVYKLAGSKMTMDLVFLSKKDEIRIFEFLRDKQIHIEF